MDNCLDLRKMIFGEITNSSNIEPVFNMEDDVIWNSLFSCVCKLRDVEQEISRLQFTH